MSNVLACERHNFEQEHKTYSLTRTFRRTVERVFLDNTFMVTHPDIDLRRPSLTSAVHTENCSSRQVIRNYLPNSFSSDSISVTLWWWVVCFSLSSTSSASRAFKSNCCFSRLYLKKRKTEINQTESFRISKVSSGMNDPGHEKAPDRVAAGRRKCLT